MVAVVVTDVAVAVATVKYKTFYLIYNINLHVSTTAKANIDKSFFNHTHRLYPIQTSMNVKMRTVAVITNV